MDATPREAVHALFAIERARDATTRSSLDNGTLLMVWGSAFLLDLLGFDVSRFLALHLRPGDAASALAGMVSRAAPLSAPPALMAGVIWMTALNSAVLIWRVWYARRLPIRLPRTLANGVIFWWSWYYVALMAVGLGGWALWVGAYPMGWFTLLGLLGALPLWLAGLRQRRRRHQADANTKGRRI